MNFVPKAIEDYATEHSTPGSELLYQLYRETYQKVLQPRMLSGRLQGRLLSALAKLIRPEFILEIGTYTGYSALCLAEGLRENGKLLTLDINEELEDLATKYFERSAYAKQIEMRICDALLELPKLTQAPDLVFLDADKSNYLNYYQLLIPTMKPGAYILADNVLWSGKVVEPIQEKDKDTRTLLEFNAFVLNDPRVENVLLPIRDGLNLIRVR